MTDLNPLRLAALLVTLAGVGAPAIAQACTPAFPSTDRVFPRDGSDGVSPDAAVFVGTNRLQNNAEVRLVGARTGEMPLVRSGAASPFVVFEPETALSDKDHWTVSVGGEVLSEFTTEPIQWAPPAVPVPVSSTLTSRDPQRVPCNAPQYGVFEFEADRRAFLVAQDGEVEDSLFGGGSGSSTSFDDRITTSPNSGVVHFGAVSPEGVFSGWSDSFEVEWPNQSCTSSQDYGLIWLMAPLLLGFRRRSLVCEAL